METFDEVRRAKKGEERFSTPLSSQPMKKDLDKIRGSLIGGAVGDALGYPVEFMRADEIFQKYGEAGITEYSKRYGQAEISDDTQMTLFTANGLLCAETEARLSGESPQYLDCIAKAYKNWYFTQTGSFPKKKDTKTCWLLNEKRLAERRAPGLTCMRALRSGDDGSPEYPFNDSKGCGGIMRVAPIALYFGETELAPLTVDFLGAEAAALTHGHALGYLPAAMQVHIVRLLAHREGTTIREAVLDSMTAMEKLFGGVESLSKLLVLVQKAMDLADSDTEELEAIRQLGEGWVAEETLAIAVYCALKHADDFEKAVTASVNHDGDSDSTGAVTGNIMGAALGYSKIPQKYIKDLELLDIMEIMAEDLYRGCPLKKNEACRTREELDWKRKYAEAVYSAEQ